MEPEPDYDGAAASAEEGEPPPLAEQHAFLDLAKRYDWGAVEKSLSQHPHPQAVVNAQPAGRWAALHHTAVGTIVSLSLLPPRISRPKNTLFLLGNSRDRLGN
jgi:hypothetical protein